MRSDLEHSEFVFCDLQEIACFMRRQDASLPGRFFAATRKTFLLIAVNPRLGKLWKSSLPEELRSRPVMGFQNYMIFYWIRDDKIMIWRVLHGSRDLPALLND